MRRKIARYRDDSCALSLRSTVSICTGTSETVANRSYIVGGTKKMSLLISRYLLDLNCWASRREAPQPLLPLPRMNYAFQRNFVSRDNIPKSKGSLLVSLPDNDRPSSISQTIHTPSQLLISQRFTTRIEEYKRLVYRVSLWFRYAGHWVGKMVLREVRERDVCNRSFYG